MVQWGPGPDALFMLHLIKVHAIKPNYQAIAASMGDDFTHRALSHRLDAIRTTAENYEETMALQASAAAQAIAKGNKRGPSTRSTTLTTTKPTASKAKGTKSAPLKPTAKSGVKKRSAPAKKGKAATKAEPKGKEREKTVEEEDDHDSDATITDMEMGIHGGNEAGDDHNVTMEAV